MISSRPDIAALLCVEPSARARYARSAAFAIKQNFDYNMGGGLEMSVFCDCESLMIDAFLSTIDASLL
jgi:hypothetical protein